MIYTRIKVMLHRNLLLTVEIKQRKQLWLNIKLGQKLRYKVNVNCIKNIGGLVLWGYQFLHCFHCAIIIIIIIFFLFYYVILHIKFQFHL